MAFVIAAAIAAFVLAYDSWTKRHAVAGPVMMGACRGLNLCLGMAAAPAAFAAKLRARPAAFCLYLFNHRLSRGEVHGGGRRVAGLALAGVDRCHRRADRSGRGGDRSSLFFTVLLAWRVLPAFSRAYRRPDPLAIRQAVKAGILSLVVLDAALAATYAGAVDGLAVLGLAVVAYGLSRLFAVT